MSVFLVIGKYCYNWNLFSLLTITRFTNMKETNDQPKNPIKFSQPQRHLIPLHANPLNVNSQSFTPTENIHEYPWQFWDSRIFPRSAHHFTDIYTYNNFFFSSALLLHWCHSWWNKRFASFLGVGCSFWLTLSHHRHKLIVVDPTILQHSNHFA